MDEAFLLLLDGKLRSHNEIVNFLKPYEPPPPPPPPAPKRGRGKAAAATEAVAAGTPVQGLRQSGAASQRAVLLRRRYRRPGLPHPLRWLQRLLRQKRQKKRRLQPNSL